MKDTYNCPVEATMGAIGGKWKVLIIHHLLEDTKRFNELKRLLPNITQRMLTSQLRELEKTGLVNRKVYAEVPPKVEYSLTKQGRTLESLLWKMHKWGTDLLSSSDTLKLVKTKNGNSFN
jgi:DNA-binding HxlR family transcriptional regulator